MTPGRPHARHSIRGALTERLPYKFAALFFAIVLWLVVSGEEPTEAVVQVRFEPRTDESLGQASSTVRVRALVEGRGRDILKLFATPPSLQPVFGADTPRRVTYRPNPRDVRLPRDVQVVVRSVAPEEMTVHFEHPGRAWRDTTR